MAALTMHGTYFGPCRALGLLGDANDGSHPVQVLPVGRALHQARSVAVRGAQLVERVFTGGVLIAEILADFAVPSV